MSSDIWTGPIPLLCMGSWKYVNAFIGKTQDIHWLFTVPTIVILMAAQDSEDILSWDPPNISLDSKVINICEIETFLTFSWQNESRISLSVKSKIQYGNWTYVNTTYKIQLKIFIFHPWRSFALSQYLNSLVKAHVNCDPY